MNNKLNTILDLEREKAKKGLKKAANIAKVATVNKFNKVFRLQREKTKNDLGKVAISAKMARMINLAKFYT